MKTALARDVFVKELSKIRDEMGFRLAGYVVMPEHVHLLICEPHRRAPLLDRKSFEAKPCVSISSKLVENKRLPAGTRHESVFYLFSFNRSGELFYSRSGGMGLPGRSSSQTIERIHQRLPSK